MPVMGSLTGQAHTAKLSPPLLKATFTEDREIQGHFVLELDGHGFHHTSLNLICFPMCLYPSNLCLIIFKGKITTHKKKKKYIYLFIYLFIFLSELFFQVIFLYIFKYY